MVVASKRVVKVCVEVYRVLKVLSTCPSRRGIVVDRAKVGLVVDMNPLVVMVVEGIDLLVVAVKVDAARFG